MSDIACMLRGMRWDGGVEYSGGDGGGYVLHRVTGSKLEIPLHWGKNHKSSGSHKQIIVDKIKFLSFVKWCFVYL